MTWKKTICLAACLISITGAASACTLFAATGDDWVQGGGTLIVKNRDWKPEWQEMRLIEDSKYRYYGLFAGDLENLVLRGGVNEKGLAAISATASSIPKRERKQMAHAKKPFLKTVLGQCASVDEALAHTELFLGSKFIMLADADKVAYVEIAYDGKYRVKIQKNGTLAHTNHYLEPDLQWANMKIGPSTQNRYNRIEQLLASGGQPYTLENFITFSQNQQDGPDFSIWRTGSTPTKTQTLATLAIYIPKNKNPELYVKIRTAPDEQGRETTYSIAGNELFPQKEPPTPDSFLTGLIKSIQQWVHRIFG